MALFKFTRGILEGTPIDIYNHGEMWRDFTYVDDLVRGIRLLIDAVPPLPGAREEEVPGDSLSPAAPFRVVNIGNSDKVRLLDFVDAIEQELGAKAIRNYMPMQTGDVPATWANARPDPRAHRLQAEHAVPRGRRALRRLVSRLLRRVSARANSVGLGVAQTLFASLVQDYLRARDFLGTGLGTSLPEGKMVALVGDAEMDEGNIFEALLEGWKHGLRNTWWIVDYNRQSLDAVVREGLWERFESIFRNFGWDVVILKYGRLQQAAFK